MLINNDEYGWRFVILKPCDLAFCGFIWKIFRTNFLFRWLLLPRIRNEPEDFNFQIFVVRLMSIQWYYYFIWKLFVFFSSKRHVLNRPFGQKWDKNNNSCVYHNLKLDFPITLSYHFLPLCALSFIIFMCTNG